MLALGDSLTQGYYHKGRRHHPYTDKLEYLLNKDGHKCFVIDNLGKERNMAADMARRLGEYLSSGIVFSYYIKKIHNLQTTNFTKKIALYNTSQLKMIGA